MGAAGDFCSAGLCWSSLRGDGSNPDPPIFQLPLPRAVTKTWWVSCCMWGFLKWWHPTTMGFPTKNDHFGMFWGYHHLWKHPYRGYAMTNCPVKNSRIFFMCEIRILRPEPVRSLKFQPPFLLGRFTSFTIFYRFIIIQKEEHL